MSRVRAEIELDEALLRLVEDLANRSGQSRDAMIEDAMRECFQAGTVAETLPKVEARSGFGAEQNLAVAQAQAEALKVEREALRSS